MSFGDAVVRACPCGGVPVGASIAQCCGPLLAGQSADTAQRLMRSRFTAYATGDADYLFRTWHPRTRPEKVDLAADLTWLGLDIVDTVAGGPEDEDGIVEFRAHWSSGTGQAAQRGSLHERSEFTRRASRWVYVRQVANG